MRKLKIVESMSLDGVIQHSVDGDDFPFDAWTVPYRTPEGLNLVLAAHGETFDVLFGRRTYDILGAFWPKAPSSPMADRMNAGKKYVVTHRPESLEWGPFEALGPDVAQDVRRVKEEDGPDIVVVGSSTLTSTLLGEGLVDDLVVITYPVLLGTGKRLFAEGTPAQFLEFVNTDTSPTGVLLTTYAKAED